MLICPHCGAALVADGSRFVCAHHHSFDRAREGYVYLLRGKRIGDSKEMLLARRAFLERGHYEPLARLVTELVVAHAPPGGAIVDAGCGEGYYLAWLARHLRNAPTDAAQGTRWDRPAGEVHTAGAAIEAAWSYVGLDSSKWAARLAAKRLPAGLFVVADLLERLPLADGAARALLDIFAPRNIPEFARLLAPGGLLLIAIPAPDHLAELRATLDLLSIEEHKEERLLQSLEGLFEVLETRSLAYTLELGPEDLLQLVSMTPNARHRERGWEERLSRAADLQVQAAFTVLACRKRDRPGQIMSPD